MSPTQMRSENVSLQVEQTDIIELLEIFIKYSYYASTETPEVTVYMKKVIELMNIDYTTVVLNNKSGSLCDTYPSHIPIQVYENNTKNAKTIHEDSYDPAELYALFKDAKKARCRERFAVPVIFYKGKHILRSATLATLCEMHYRDGVDKIKNVIGMSSEPDEPVCAMNCCHDNGAIPADKNESDNANPSSSSDPENKLETDNSDNPSVDEAGNVPVDEEPSEGIFDTHNRLRGADIKLLTKFNVTTIADLMVEERKMKMGIPVSSSEKIDKENRYRDFTLVTIPYPGCEHFVQFNDRYFEGHGIKFVWDASCDAKINVPNVIPSMEYINWNNYRDWDLITITQNYIKYLLKYFQESTSGMLIHCISGWDRTPLFISLIRLSLWADGVVHQTLDPFQMLWFTIAYDWFLFSHKLEQRMQNREAIFFFCFYMLKFISDDDFSINARRGRRSDSRSESDRNENERAENDDLHDFEIVDDDESNSNSPPTPPISPPRPNSAPRRNSPLRRTSPIQVPNSRARRNESAASSLSSMNSWQVISGTGSVTIDNHMEGAHNPLQTETPRARKLDMVRQLFYKSYFHTIGKDIDFPGNSFYRKFI